MFVRLFLLAATVTAFQPSAVGAQGTASASSLARQYSDCIEREATKYLDSGQARDVDQAIRLGASACRKLKPSQLGEAFLMLDHEAEQAVRFRFRDRAEKRAVAGSPVSRKFEILNESDATIVRLKASDVSSKDFGPDRNFGFDNHGPTNSQVKVTLTDPGKECLYDLRVNFDNGKHLDARKIDVCRGGLWIIRNDGAEWVYPGQTRLSAARDYNKGQYNQQKPWDAIAFGSCVRALVNDDLREPDEHDTVHRAVFDARDKCAKKINTSGVGHKPASELVDQIFEEMKKKYPKVREIGDDW